MNFFSKIKNIKGFTLVELLVSLGVFMIIITIVVGGFVRALRTNRQASNLIAVNSNIAIVLESMAREIRTAYGFSVFSDCSDQSSGSSSGSSSCLQYTNSSGNIIFYNLVDGSVLRFDQNPSGEKVTDNSVNVKSLRFSVSGAINLPKRITISLSISPKESGVDGAQTTIQATVSSRVPG